MDLPENKEGTTSQYIGCLFMIYIVLGVLVFSVNAFGIGTTNIIISGVDTGITAQIAANALAWIGIIVSTVYIIRGLILRRREASKQLA